MFYKIIPLVLAVTVTPFPYPPARRYEDGSLYFAGYLFGVHFFYTRGR